MYIEDINNLKIYYSGNLKLKSEIHKLITGKGRCSYSLSEFLVSSFSYNKQFSLIDIELENSIQLNDFDFSNEDIEYLILSINIKYCLANKRVINITFESSCHDVVAKLIDFEFLIDARLNF